MTVMVLVPHRVARDKADGSPGFMDYAPGQIVEIPEAQWSPVLYEALAPTESVGGETPVGNP